MNQETFNELYRWRRKKDNVADVLPIIHDDLKERVQAVADCVKLFSSACGTAGELLEDGVIAIDQNGDKIVFKHFFQIHTVPKKVIDAGVVSLIVDDCGNCDGIAKGAKIVWVTPDHAEYIGDSDWRFHEKDADGNEVIHSVSLDKFIKLNEPA